MQSKYASGTQYVVTGLTNADADLSTAVEVLSERGSWNDLATADTPPDMPEFLNSKAGEILSTGPQYTLHPKPLFFHTPHMR
jgi:hypothetical protein